MNTLDDLRATLRHEADGVDDPERYTRPVAVRERIRVVRRRRTAVAASAAVVLVAAGITAAGALVDQPEGVDPATQVVGVDVPESVTVYGFPYRLQDTDTFTGDRDHIDLAAAADEEDQWQAVSLVASGLGDGYATLFVDDQPVARASGAGDVELPVPVFDGSPTLRVEIDGASVGARAGLAVYGATGELPGSATNGTAVFRQQVAGSQLEPGAFRFSAPGESSLSVPFSGSIGEVRIAYYCHTQEKGIWLNLSTDGDGPLGTSCGSDVDIDAGDGGSTIDGGGPTGRHVLHAYLTRGSGGPRISPPDADFGIAVYREPAGSPTVLGMEVDETVEADGRLWTLDRVVPQEAPGRPVEVTLDSTGEDRLLGQVASGGTTWITWRGGLLDGESTRIGNARDVDGAGMVVDSFLPRGDTYQVTLRGQGSTPFRGALLVYRPM